MTERYDCIVIGAGISGILSSLALTKERKNVLLIEKSDTIGGNCRSYTFGGFQVDVGAHAITGLIDGPMLKLIDRYFDLRPIFMPHGHYYVRNKSTFIKFPYTMQALAGFPMLPKKDRLNLVRAFVAAAKNHTLSQKELDMSLEEFMERYDLAPVTLRFLDALCVFLSGRPKEETTVKRILNGGGATSESKTGLKNKLQGFKGIVKNSGESSQGYPKGGIRSITNAALASIPKDRIAIRKGEQVKKIVRKETFLVRTNKSVYESDTVIYTAPVRELPKILENPLPEDYQASITSLKRCLSLTLWLGLKTPQPEFDYRGSEIYFDTDTPYWAMPISNYDPNLAPEGCQLIGFSSHVPDGIDPRKQKESLFSEIISMFPEMEKDIIMKHWQLVEPEKAAITAGANFPKPKSPIDGLYLAGTDTDERSMGITRASYSVLEMLDAMRKDGLI